MYRPVKDGIRRDARHVQYNELQAPENFHQLVHCFWELKTAEPLEEDFCYHVLPDACVNLLFDQAKPDVAAVTSIDTKALVLNLGRCFHYVGVQLYPGVWCGPQNEIRKDLVKDAYSGILNLVDTNRKLLGLRFSEKVRVLAGLVQAFIDKNFIVRNATTWTILSNLDSIRSVKSMAQATGLSTRQLQRVVRESVGISPHDFLKVLRIQKSFREDAVALYTDQAHYIHSFRRITGYTPKTYQKKFDV